MALQEQPYCFSYPLSQIVHHPSGMRVDHAGNLQIQGVAFCQLVADIGGDGITCWASIESVRWYGAEVKPLLTMAAPAFFEELRTVANQHSAYLFDTCTSSTERTSNPATDPMINFGAGIVGLANQLLYCINNEAPSVDDVKAVCEDWRNRVLNAEWWPKQAA